LRELAKKLPQLHSWSLARYGKARRQGKKEVPMRKLEEDKFAIEEDGRES